MTRDDYGSGLARGGRRLSTATAEFDDDDEFGSLRPPKGKQNFKLFFQTFSGIMRLFIKTKNFLYKVMLPINWWKIWKKPNRP